MELISRKKAASSELGGLLNFHNSTFSTPRNITQVGNFQAIEDLAKQILEDIGIMSSINDRGRNDGE